ncbi:protein-tyrosine phosphatase [Devosia enhydra]|uniref:Protein-tyrosine phosphatase n=1 Tax=Devosia enhydra TaxID=665118 RepID=A0A1K2HZK2_9HYPH|nr:tyrosine-protein phosphatase [Devosia enhydra]SFZ85505.1 protein-tyrosine phosphatase [Devosia enhydra]
MLDAPSPLLPSLGNFRDLGGLPLGSGGRVRSSRLYRSPRLTGLAEADLATLDGYGIVALVDFRGRAEAEAAPVALSPQLMSRRIGLPIEPQAGARIRALEAFGEVSHEAAHAIMVESYRAYVTDHADTYARFIRLVAEADGAVVFHCSAGKDRTGFAAALVLAALGVPEDAILADYLRTNRDWQPPVDIGGVPASYRRALLGVDEAYLAAAFAVLNRDHGGAEHFARAALGGSEEAFARFRAVLTEH